MNEEIKPNNDPQNGTTIDRLLAEHSPDDLIRLEMLLETGRISRDEVISRVIYDWSRHHVNKGNIPVSYTRTTFQWEGPRDGDQIGMPGVRRLSSDYQTIISLLPLLPDLGIGAVNLGMPISGNREISKIIDLTLYLNKIDSPLAPFVSGRTHPDDVSAISEVANFTYSQTGRKMNVYAFVGSSRIRMLAQGPHKWNPDSIDSWLIQTISSLRASRAIGQIIIPFEDTFGSHPQDLDRFIPTALDAGADGICICDTASRGVQDNWTDNILTHIRLTYVPRYPDAVWELHLHNMMGRAVRNASIALKHGFISVLHGTFLGVGDLGGNLDIGQCIREWNGKFTHRVAEVEQTIAATRGITGGNPFTGSLYADASRYIPTGVHANAFQRLSKVGPNLRSILMRVYFPYSPEEVGLPIRLDIVTPVSGASNVMALAERLGCVDKINDITVQKILDSAKTKGEPLTDDEFLNMISGSLSLNTDYEYTRD